MSWRTVVVANQCKLSYKNGYLVVRGDQVTNIHLGEINTIIVESTQVSITGYLLCELISKKIKIIFCDGKANPAGELVPYYGSHNSSKRILAQSKWEDQLKEKVWRKIIEQKILNQAKFLQKLGLPQAKILYEYCQQIEPGDCTNREGHGAKVYFNSLFGKDFSRDAICNLNAGLDYGYTLLLAAFNKAIVSKGYLTQLGLGHKNEFNFFNLSCDFMEPFRVLVDEFVYKNRDRSFDGDYRMEMVKLLSSQIIYDGKEFYLQNAILIYVNSIFNAMESKNVQNIILYEYI